MFCAKLFTPRTLRYDVSSVVPAFQLAPLSVIGGRKQAYVMASESPGGTDATYWAGLIKVIARDGDALAFALLFEHFAPRVKTFMKRSGAGDAQADELAQETLLMVWRKAALFDVTSVGAAAWIFTIARNLRIDALRREKRVTPNEVRDIDLEFVIDDAPEPDVRLLASEAEARVRKALQSLSAEQLQVVELSFYEEHAHAEIARMLGIPLGTVKSRLRLAMNRLRSLLGDF